MHTHVANGLGHDEFQMELTHKMAEICEQVEWIYANYNYVFIYGWKAQSV